MTEAWIFPGQGSQTVGMARDLHDRHPEARAVFDEADATLGEIIDTMKGVFGTYDETPEF